MDNFKPKNALRLIGYNVDVIMEIYENRNFNSIKKPNKNLLRAGIIQEQGKGYVLNSNLYDFIRDAFLNNDGNIKFGSDNFEQRLLEFKQNNTLNREQMRDFEHFIMGSLNKIKTDFDILMDKIKCNLYVGQNLEQRKNLKDSYVDYLKKAFNVIELLRNGDSHIFFIENENFDNLRIETFEVIEEQKLYSRLRSSLTLGDEILKPNDSNKRGHIIFENVLLNNPDILDNIPNIKIKSLFNLNKTKIIDFSQSINEDEISKLNQIAIEASIKKQEKNKIDDQDIIVDYIPEETRENNKEQELFDNNLKLFIDYLIQENCNELDLKLIYNKYNKFFDFGFYFDYLLMYILCSLSEDEMFIIDGTNTINTFNVKYKYQINPEKEYLSCISNIILIKESSEQI